MKKIKLGIIFGSKSTEHDVSIITTIQAYSWINPKKYDPILIYLNHQNQPYLAPLPKNQDYQSFIKKTLNNNIKVEFVNNGIKFKKSWKTTTIKIDVALLIMHGTYGEDGKIQGMLDFYEIPYTGSGVLGSALGMDKVAMKDIFVKLHFPTRPYVWFWMEEYTSSPQLTIKMVNKKLKYPVFVKPANGGSSIGLYKVLSPNKLKEAIVNAGKYDNKILIEEAIDEALDINCAVIGGYNPIASLCDQLIIKDKFFTFGEKYLKGGKSKGMANAGRIIPAPIPESSTKKIQEMAITAFKELGCWGAVRMDFLYQQKTKKAFPGEINTIPGSFAFYLWEASGLKKDKLIDKMVDLALLRHKEERRLDRSFKSPILDQK